MDGGLNTQGSTWGARGKGGSQGSGADAGARAADWSHADVRRCAERASRGGAGAGRGWCGQERAAPGEGGEARGCDVGRTKSSS